jgi:hypothetical protein
MSLGTLRLPWVVDRDAAARDRVSARVSDRAADRVEPATSGKLVASAFSIVMLVVVASPVVENWKAQPRDDFPLSYFPMFSEDRADAQRVTYVVGSDGRGNQYLIPYQYAGRGGMNQVRRQINKLVDQGAAPRLCQTVAGRLAGAGGGLPEIQTIEVITGTYRLSEYFTGRQAPIAESVHARCSVRRSAS